MTRQLVDPIIYLGLHRGRVAPSREHNHHLHLSTDLERVIQRYEAHLESIHDGENAEALCASAPNDFKGLHFDHPTSCANWVGDMVPVILSLLMVFYREGTVSLEYGLSRIRAAEIESVKSHSHKYLQTSLSACTISFLAFVS